MGRLKSVLRQWIWLVSLRTSWGRKLENFVHWKRETKMINLGVEGRLDKEPKKIKQECIPVRCVPPTYWPYPMLLGGGGSSQLPLDADPLDADHPWMQTTAGCRSPRCRSPWKQTLFPGMWPVMHAEKPTSAPVNRQRGVKTLPCPKLRLRVVNIFFPEVFLSVTDSSRKVLLTDYFSPHLNN